MLIDINEERAYGEMLDMRDSIEYLNRNVKVKTGTYAECGDMDIIVITAGAPPKQGRTRLDTLEMSAKIAKSIVEPIMKSGFDGIFIAISIRWTLLHIISISCPVCRKSGDRYRNRNRLSPFAEYDCTDSQCGSAKCSRVFHGGTWRFPDGAVVYGYDRRKTVL